MPKHTSGHSLRISPGNTFLPHPETASLLPGLKAGPLRSSLHVHASGHYLGMGKETEALEDVQGARTGLAAAGKEAEPMSWPVHRPKGPSPPPGWEEPVASLCRGSSSTSQVSSQHMSELRDRQMVRPVQTEGSHPSWKCAVH